MNLKSISAICTDSRKIQKDCLFVAIKGDTHDGHDFIPMVIDHGAKIVVHEQDVTDQKPGVEYIQVVDSHQALAEIANEFYGNPSSQLKLVGVTGTNGKTTTATLLAQLFNKLGYKSALLSTIENKIGDQSYPATHTTPDPVALNEFLAKAVQEGCQYAFMECSSHAIDQKRVWGLEFAGAIFTNLTQDHLDYHKTIESYAKTKKALFDHLPETSFALSNLDDQYGQYMLQDTRAHKYFYSLNSKADFSQQIKTKMIGKFNAYNALSIYATAVLLGANQEEVLHILSELDPPAGRLETIRLENNVLGVVDYAHTPDALENVLVTLRETTPDHIITVVGCGGDRDKTKRPLMGEIAVRLSDYTIFTSDNPRSEDPEKILDDIVAGLNDSTKYEREVDRSKAIALAVGRAQPGDIVLVAGKGHEDYQILGDKKIHFSDREELERIFNQQRLSRILITRIP